MTENKRFKKGDFEEGCPRFIPFERERKTKASDSTGNEITLCYNLFDIVDTEKLDYVDFIDPYMDIQDCNRDCNIMNVVDYLLKELRE